MLILLDFEIGQCDRKEATEREKVGEIGISVGTCPLMIQVLWLVMYLRTLTTVLIALDSDPGTFDGERLHWSVPRVMTPLVQDNSSFVSSKIQMGIDTQLLDSSIWKAQGLRLEETGPTITISVPFGAQGGYRKVRVLCHNALAWHGMPQKQRHFCLHFAELCDGQRLPRDLRHLSVLRASFYAGVCRCYH